MTQKSIELGPFSPGERPKIEVIERTVKLDLQAGLSIYPVRHNAFVSDDREF